MWIGSTERIALGAAADGGEQPHVHLMFSERQRDGIERDPEQYFRRYNAKAPEKGGARKGYGPSAGQTLTKAERAAELKELRGRWEAMCNAHLERAGVEQRIDMRSHAERGTGLEPERKQLPSQWRGQGRANVIEFRQARQELAEARQELARAVPDARAEVIHLEAERQRREQAQREARERAEREKAQQERQRLERMSSRELAAEIAKLRPPPVRDLVERDPAVIEADQQRRALEEQHHDARTREAMARHEAEQWRQAHPLRAKAHDSGLFRSAYLDERAKIEAEARQEWLTVAPRIEDAALRGRQARSDAEVRITVEQTPIRAKVAELEALQKEKARQEREAEAKRLAEQRAERERNRAAEKFRSMAQKRQLGVSGYTDRSSDWKATPQPLRDLIDEYNRQPKEVQAAILARIRDNPKVREQVADMLKQRENSRDHGLSR